MLTEEEVLKKAGEGAGSVAGYYLAAPLGRVVGGILFGPPGALIGGFVAGLFGGSAGFLMGRENPKTAIAVATAGAFVKNDADVRARDPANPVKLGVEKKEETSGGSTVTTSNIYRIK
jgi:hypothetical protein